MIKNWAKETKELSLHEKENIHRVKDIILRDKSDYKTNKDINAYMSLFHDVKFRPERLRKIIHAIRMLNLIPCLIATNKGYYIAKTESEVNDYIESLQQRINSIEDVARTLRLQRVSTFY
jgi:hypothetical protein